MLNKQLSVLFSFTRPSPDFQDLMMQTKKKRKFINFHMPFFFGSDKSKQQPIQVVLYVKAQAARPLERPF